MKTTPFVAVVTTVDARAAADRIARAVVEKRLAACAQVAGPIDSTYWWKGAIETAREWRVEMKARADMFDSLATAITALHPYDTPEIVAVPIVSSGARYLDWLVTETGMDMR